MDVFSVACLVPGSRCPVLVPAPLEIALSSSSSHTPTPSPDNTTSQPITPAVRNRRKPHKVFRSPSAAVDSVEMLQLPREPRAGGRLSNITANHPATDPNQQEASSPTTTTTTASASSSEPPYRRRKAVSVPFMSLYHPLGSFARSLPPLDPARFGLPSSILVYDAEERAESEDARARRLPAGAGEPADAVPRERNPSPRKRRGGGAGKRKRRDADDGDTLFPPPPKRTRNPRGAAASRATPSPLVTADTPASNGMEEDGGGGAEEAAVVVPKRSVRTRKPRALPAKRRGSSGSSTGTSVSVSIAAVAKAKGPVEPGRVNGAERREEEEADEDMERNAPAVPNGILAVLDPALLPRAPPPPLVKHFAAPGPTVPALPGVPKPRKEEREEGELSEEGEVAPSR